MKNKTPLFPGFHLATLRKKPRSAQQNLANELLRFREKTFGQISSCFQNYIPGYFLFPNKTGQMSRRRLYSKENTFWAFLSQVLDSDGGCMEVVRKLQAYASLKSDVKPSSSTAAYCKARQKLNVQDLNSIFDFTAKNMFQKRSLLPFIIDVSLLLMELVLVCLILLKTKLNGHNQKTKNLDVVFQQHVFAHASLWTLAYCLAIESVIKKVMKSPCFVINGIY